jgi:hypothetical protein
LVASGLLLGALSCRPPSPVVQGKVAVIDAKSVSVVDELRPDAPPLVLDISRAEIGNLPVVGDVVRVVYQVDGSTNRALALMNVTRQELNEGKAP